MFTRRPDYRGDARYALAMSQRDHHSGEDSPAGALIALVAIAPFILVIVNGTPWLALALFIFAFLAIGLFVQIAMGHIRSRYTGSR